MKIFLSLKFWFNMRPGSLIPMFAIALKSIVAAFFILAIASFLLKRKKGLYRAIWVRLYSFSVTNCFIGLILMFLNYEQTPFFTSRFWYIIWAIEMIIWLYFIAKQYKQIPQKKEIFEKEKEYKKYIP